MIHNFTAPSGEGKIAQNIRELQEAVKKITPKSTPTLTVNTTSHGSSLSTNKTVAESANKLNVVSRWL